MKKNKKPLPIKIIKILSIVAIFFLSLIIPTVFFAIFSPAESGFFYGFQSAFLDKYDVTKNNLGEFCGRIIGIIFVYSLFLFGIKKRGKVFYILLLIVSLSRFNSNIIFIIFFLLLLLPKSRKFFLAKKVITHKA